ncbi:MAG TPA: carbon-nitrogen hydrolase family protein [Thermoanaerobaculia bacterium]
MKNPLTIALASPSVASSLDEGLQKVERLISEASDRGAQIVCFPEAYLPGLRGVDFEVPLFDEADERRAIESVSRFAREHSIATIVGIEKIAPEGHHIAAAVFDRDGNLQGWQTKNQIAPEEDSFYVPGRTRQLFEVNGVKFGIAICHEAWRYPETVRWAAVRGAKIVFQPYQTGSDKTGVRLTEWGSPAAPYYEKAMVMRSIENAIWFASVNYAMKFQESATAIIAPSGEMHSFLPYGEEGVLVDTIDIEAATGLIAQRYAPDRYQDSHAAEG